jgi:hypothetical protein
MRPGTVTVFPVDIDVLVAKPFETQITVYLEDNGIRQETIKVQGIGIDPGGPNNAEPPS